MKVEDIQKRIDEMVRWTDLRVYFSRVRRFWKKRYEPPFIKFLDEKRKLLVSACEKDCLDDLKLDIICEPEGKVKPNIIGPRYKEPIPKGPKIINISFDLEEIEGNFFDAIKGEVARQAYELHKHNKAKTAKALGISIKTLYNYL